MHHTKLFLPFFYQQLERDVDGLEASGQADFSSALRFAFEKFKEVRIHV